MDRADQLLSTRYAKAFTHVYGKRITEADSDRLDTLSSVIHQEATPLALLKIPTISNEIKRQVLEQLLSEKVGLSPVFNKLVYMLIEDQRAVLLQPVLERVKEQYDKDHHIERFVLVSSHPLSYDDHHALVAFLERSTGRRIKARMVIDPRLIAGIRLQSREHLWEYSIARDLAKLGLTRRVQIRN